MVVSTVAAADSALWAAIRSASVSASSSGTSPEVTTTMPVKSSGSAARPQRDGVAGAELLVLDRDVDGAAQLVGQLGDRGRDAVAVVAEHHDEVLRRHLGHRMQRVRQHAAAGQRVQHLRGVRAHAGTCPGGQDQDRGLAMHVGHPALPCRQPLRRASLMLRRQDSNLNYLNQNQRCCRLHHDGLINS